MYQCKLGNELNQIVIQNCELLVDSGNTACDLLLTFHDAKKFELTPSIISMTVGGLTGGAIIIKMLPALLVTFALRDANGVVQEKSASVDAWVMKHEIDSFNDTQSTAVVSNITTVTVGATPVNNPSPVKHMAHGSANLGESGCKKLKLKYDFNSDEISFISAIEDLPEI